MAEILPEINIKNIHQKQENARRKKTAENNENTNLLLKKVLGDISLRASVDSPGNLSIGLQDMYHKEVYPGADRQKVLNILKDRGFEASIGRACPAFPDCECSEGPCMDWVRVENTWSS